MEKKHLKKIFIFLSLLVVIFLIVMGIFLWSIFNEKPPIFFPLDNPQGEYKIVKGCPNGQGWSAPLIGQENLFCIEYLGTGIFNYKNDEIKSSSITVGKSKIDLEQFNGKKVKIIKGEFVNSSKQCIQNKCIDLNIRLIVLDIDKLEVAE